MTYQKKSSLKFLIITLGLISICSKSLFAQDLDLVAPKPKVSENNSSETDLELNLSSEDGLKEIELVTISDQENRDPETYRKQNYLNEIVRLTYYQKLTTPAWAKFLSPNIWKKSVAKWRYWDQLKNYITGNNEDLIQIREKLEIKEDTVSLTPEDTSIIVALVEDVSLQSRLETIASIDQDEKPLEEKQITSEAKDLSKENLRRPPTEDIKEVPLKSNVSKSEEENKVKTVATKPSSEKPIKKDEKKVVANKPVETKVTEKPVRTSSAPVISRSTLNNLFRNQKGFLPWPVRGGRITDRFGFRQNAAARGLKPDNFGIDMRCPPGSSINAVHDGVVLMAVKQAPYDYIVTIKHGDYTSAYFFLISKTVNPGDKVVVGQSIGRLRSGVDEADFHFEIWDNQNRVNPEFWLKKR